jgi:hypothetical protein
MAAVHRSAASLRITLTADSVALARAGDAVKRFDVMPNTNDGVRRPWLGGEGYMNFAVASARLKAAMVATFARPANRADGKPVRTGFPVAGFSMGSCWVPKPKNSPTQEPLETRLSY